MTKVSIEDAFDEGQFVSAKRFGEVTVCQVWYGGTMVRVFTHWGDRGSYVDEAEPWTLADEKGRAPEQEEVKQHMEMHFGLIAEEMGWEA